MAGLQNRQDAAPNYDDYLILKVIMFSNLENVQLVIA
jgi:hypothetical protein